MLAPMPGRPVVSAHSRHGHEPARCWGPRSHLCVGAACPGDGVASSRPRCHALALPGSARAPSRPRTRAAEAARLGVGDVEVALGWPSGLRARAGRGAVHHRAWPLAAPTAVAAGAACRAHARYRGADQGRASVPRLEPAAPDHGCTAVREPHGGGMGDGRLGFTLNRRLYTVAATRPVHGPISAIIGPGAPCYFYLNLFSAVFRNKNYVFLYITECIIICTSKFDYLDC